MKTSLITSWMMLMILSTFVQKSLQGKRLKMIVDEATSINAINSKNNEFGKLEGRRTKVDKLGSVLKSRVAELRSQNGADLVFLVDSSASVGSQNFHNEIKFIRKLLADFTVSVNTTRVVVITYSSVDRVIKQIDHITDPQEDFHKCRLLDHDIPSINYRSGGTYTLGALLEAIKVFKFSRPSSSRAIFLITDGYSNGGDPRPAADVLRVKLGVKIFTFGIRNGNVKELKDMASDPKDEHAFILDSFDEFEALARRALHEDLTTGVYIDQPAYACSNLCQNSPYFASEGLRSSSAAFSPVFDTSSIIDQDNCCDPKATCSCGTHTGHFTCLCPPGHYGRGLIGDCKECPRGSYKTLSDPGDIRSCIKCPLKHQTSDPGSTSLQNCRCKEGYLFRNGRCQLQDCPQLKPPEHGYFIRDACDNVFNAACGIRCKSGYELKDGDSMRLCQTDGKWSGKQPKCFPTQCQLLEDLENGKKVCQGQDSGSECRFTCNKGFKLVGSNLRICLPIAIWTGLRPICRPVHCPRLRKPNYGIIYPQNCNSKRTPFGGRCAFSCNPGFTLQGPSLRECLEDGSWNGGPHLTRCVDTTPPKIICPSNITVEADKDSHYATIQMGVPEATDNSGYPPAISSIPVLEDKMKFKIGLSEVVINAEDLIGNSAKCRFSVTVEDKQSPSVDLCSSPPIYLVDDIQDVELGEAMVDWSPPIFHDNSLKEVNVSRTILVGGQDELDPSQVLEDGSSSVATFPIGITTKVEYIAIDASGNNATCVLNITLQEHHCLLPDDPINGHKNCSSAEAMPIYCTLTCNEGYAFAYQSLEDYYCPAFEQDVEFYDDDDIKEDISENFDDIEIILAGKLEKNLTTVQDLRRKKRSLALPIQEPHPWLPEGNPPPFPDCSVIYHATMAMTSASMLFEIPEESDMETFCDDPFFLGQVTESVRSQIAYNLPNICSDDLDCDIAEMDSLCEDILDEKRSKRSLRERWNKVKKRRRKRRRLKIMFMLLGSPKSSSLTQQRNVGRTKMGKVVREIGNQNKISSVKVVTKNNVTKTMVLPEPQFQAGQVVSYCKPGSIRKGEFCVNCPVGTFHDVSSDVCSSCPVGTFQPVEAQMKCLDCPRFTSTSNGSRAASVNSCKRICSSGTYSKDGLEPCIRCPKGTFQPSAGSVACLACPSNKTTEFPGSTSNEKCYSPCPTGSISRTGLDKEERCIPCPENYFQDKPGQNQCFKCPSGTSTRSLKGAADNAMCAGDKIDDVAENLGTLEFNDCLSDPCQNGAACHPLDSFGFQCICKQGFTGMLCQHVQDYCISSPCMNGGQCSNLPEEFSCSCPDVFTGKYCDIDIDECSKGVPCQNGGLCVNTIGGYICDCKEGYEGEHCQTRQSPCQYHSCQNNATCLERTNGSSYLCKCQPDFQGDFCEENIDDCLDQPCENGGSCINKDGMPGFTCTCLNGFEGETCHVNINECSSSPCLNGGICIDLVGDFQCSCNPGYNGKDCNNKMNPNFVMHFGVEDFSVLSSEYVMLDQLNSPELDKVSFCLWISTTDKGNYGTPLSYSIPDQDNEITFTDYNGFVLSIKGNKVVTDITANDGAWAFLCVTWRSNDGEWRIYKNGKLADQGKDLSKGLYIEGNGILILGQEQDTFGGGFSGSEAFKGKLYSLNIWNEYFNQEAVNELMTDCDSTDFNFESSMILSWANFRDPATRHGFIEIEDVIICKGCSSLSPPSHGYVRILGGTNRGLTSTIGQDQLTLSNSRAVYSCQEGYSLSLGDRVRTCGILGDWRGTQPICKLIDCGFPGYLENGFVEHTDTLYGAEALYWCRRGYQLVSGDSSRRCTKSGSWSGSRPVCQATVCRVTESFPNGIILNPKVKYAIGEVLKLQCKDPYVMDGPEKLSCLDDGSWSDLLPTCTPPPCLENPVLENGRTIVTEVSGYRLPMVTNITKAVCQEGYILQNPNINHFVCLNTLWKGPNGSSYLPQCLAIDCCQLPSIKNSLYTRKPPSNGFRSKGTISCKEGYHLFLQRPNDLKISSKSASFVCSSKQIWTATTLRTNSRNVPFSSPLSNIKCKKLQCPLPSKIQNGMVEYSGLTVGSMARYSCKRPFKIQGKAQLRCLPSGQWGTDLPSCKKHE